MTFEDKRTQPNETLFYSLLEDDIVKCNVCRQECTIRPGQTGTCGLRLNKEGKLVNMIYGTLCSVSVDPIEKKPLHHFLPGTSILSIGSFGCNFQCQFCQNWDISQEIMSKKKDIRRAKAPEETIEQEIEELGSKFTPVAIINQVVKSGCPSIAFTYNEPTTFVEFAFDCMTLAHTKGIKTVFVTNGFQSDETIKALAPYMSAVNIDLKSFNSTFYKKICNADLDGVLNSIRLWVSLGIWVEVTTLGKLQYISMEDFLYRIKFIEGQNDSDEEIKKIADFLVGVNPNIVWHISAAFPAAEMMDIPNTSFSTLKRVYQIGKTAGLRYIYTGNVSQTDYMNTSCTKCKKLLVKRGWMGGQVVSNNFDAKTGKCSHCGEILPGIWQ